MKKFLAAAIAAFGFVNAASAADMPVKVYTAPAAAAYNWSGWYIGLNAGGNWGTSKGSTASPFVLGAGLYLLATTNDIGAAGAHQSFNTSGFTGGIQSGYNWQSGNMLVGMELDFESFRSAGSKSVTAPLTGFPSQLTIASSIATDWLFTARPRLGIVSNNWLWYATGGVAVTKLKAAWNFSENLTPGTESASVSATKVGWVAGGGVETALPGKFSLGVEYLYVKFGSVSTTSSNAIILGVAQPAQVFYHSADLASNIVRVRLNKQF